MSSRPGCVTSTQLEHHIDSPVVAIHPPRQEEVEEPVAGEAEAAVAAAAAEGEDKDKEDESKD